MTENPYPERGDNIRHGIWNEGYNAGNLDAQAEIHNSDRQHNKRLFMWLLKKLYKDEDKDER